MLARKLLRVGIGVPVFLALVAAGGAARAQTDDFGTGDGHSGAKTAAAADEVINSYAALTADAAKGATSVTVGAVVGDPTGFAVGDLVMVWRATGVAAAEAPSASQATVDLATATSGVVGLWELARVSAVTAVAGGFTIAFTKPLVNAFAKDVSQVVRVPEYTTVSVPAGASLAAAPWQTSGTGFAGGLLVFLAKGAVTVDGRVHADARGFRGGPAVKRLANLVVSCQNDDGTVEEGYAPKGEGVVSTEFGDGKGGRGNRADGAGGGNCVENGGGGGGNRSKGGKGGESVIAGIGGTPRGGLGGAEIDYALVIPPGASGAARLSCGGGGGAGEQKNGLGSAGGVGGGTVFFRAQSLAGAGIVSANGADAANAQLVGVESDGAGGGGAGGTVLVRVVDTAACGSVQAKGGKGGDSQQIGLSFFGPGGGGAGGRVLLQAKSRGGCTADVAPGAKGTANGSDRGAAAGGAGEDVAVPPPGGGYCYSNPAANPQCQNGLVCDVPSGFCLKCTGPFGGNSSHACAVAADPVCRADGTCAPCKADFGTAGPDTCQLSGKPFCITAGPVAGSCGKCSTNADCQGPTHPGPACNPTLGACGTACTDDSQCKGTEWCSLGVCVPKTTNGEHVPDVPPIDGECTKEKGQRVCLSAVCEEDDDLCGLHNGSPCDGKDERCRSKICFAADKLCGKPSGEPCTDNAECRSALCEDGVCKGCKADTDCKTSQVCDTDKDQCVDGCREKDGKSNCVAPQECSKKDGTIGQCVTPTNGDAGTGTDAGEALDASGIIEGGGCACRTSVATTTPPLAALGAAFAALALARRRRKTDSNGNRG